MERLFVDNLEPNIALVVRALKDISAKQESNAEIVALLERLEAKSDVVEAIKSIPGVDSVSLRETKDILSSLEAIKTAVSSVKLDSVSIKEARDLKEGLDGIVKAVKAKDLSVNLDLSGVEKELSSLLEAVQSIRMPEFALPEAQIEALKPFEDYATREGQEDIVEAIKGIKVGGGAGGPTVISLKDTNNAIVNPASAEGLEAIVTAIENQTPPAGGATEAKQDSQITEMQAIRSEIGIKDIFITLKTLIQAISYPAWFDRSQNLIRTQVSGSLTTVSTVTTVTGVTNIDGYQGKMQIINQNQSAWANVVRSRIS